MTLVEILREKISHGIIYRFPILETEFKVFSVHGLVLNKNLRSWKKLIMDKAEAETRSR